MHVSPPHRGTYDVIYRLKPLKIPINSIYRVLYPLNDKQREIGNTQIHTEENPSHGASEKLMLTVCVCVFVCVSALCWYCYFIHESIELCTKIDNMMFQMFTLNRIEKKGKQINIDIERPRVRNYLHMELHSEMHTQKKIAIQTQFTYASI